MRAKLKEFFYEKNYFKLASFVWGGISFICLILGFFDILSYWFVAISLFFSIFLYNYSLSISAKKFLKMISDKVIEVKIEDDVIDLKIDGDDGKWKK